MSTNPPSLVLFDGVCNLCNAGVNLLVSVDKHRRLRYASLQSEVGIEACARYGVDATALESIIFIDEDGLHRESMAALRIARTVGGWFGLLYGLVIIPRPLRDYAYQVIARNRYRWFGQADTCRLPTAAERTLFLG